MHNLHAHLVFDTKYRRGMFDTEMLNLCEQLMAQVCTGFGATLAGLNGAQDHVHLLAAYPPQVALSHLVNNLKRLIQAVAAGLRRQDQPGCEARQVLVTVILRQILR